MFVNQNAAALAAKKSAAQAFATANAAALAAKKAASQAFATKNAAALATMRKRKGFGGYEADAVEDFEMYESSEFGALPPRPPFPGMGMRHPFPGMRPPFPGMRPFPPRPTLSAKTAMTSSPTVAATGASLFRSEEMGLYVDDGFGNYELQGVLIPRVGTPAWQRWRKFGIK